MGKNDEEKTMWQLNKTALKDVLENNIVTVIFTKANGEERTMKCTLLPSYLPVKIVKESSEGPQLLLENRKEPENSIAVWDLDIEGWRSFRVDSVKRISF